ncbi:transmembrane protein, putative (macronuclear) [Tetrahymena thermophila SB210]|uniref:Transmembrane protein, putative n=1 Tax=Tetrahymena thermophila (strain SB210) TaxID=312017 RepID=I7M831_TETTS|nr:transmembrane protein, putative [Tetrahymena thermophila SB210]EAR96509.1 transmembrane protein, putative [Tetrahymena thermophila SB210]|eukprot:XP_001016754.1 transmembrane protein, putative [Tetrahymena thermophila SB210]
MIDKNLKIAIMFILILIAIFFNNMVITIIVMPIGIGLLLWALADMNPEDLGPSHKNN